MAESACGLSRTRPVGDVIDSRKTSRGIGTAQRRQVQFAPSSRTFINITRRRRAIPNSDVILAVIRRLEPVKRARLRYCHMHSASVRFDNRLTTTCRAISRLPPEARVIHALDEGSTVSVRQPHLCAAHRAHPAVANVRLRGTPGAVSLNAEGPSLAFPYLTPAINLFVRLRVGQWWFLQPPKRLYDIPLGTRLTMKVGGTLSWRRRRKRADRSRVFGPDRPSRHSAVASCQSTH
jgi:hypothetical protein